jgi:phosphatidyl-myo-inositol dimannoside synthase
MNKTLFLSENYAPTHGGSCTMFASRFQRYPHDKIVVLTKTVEGCESFDSRQSYKIVRIPINPAGPRGFEWLGKVADFVKAAFRVALKEKVEVIQCARPIPEGLAGYILSRLLRKRLIVNFHGEDIGVLRNYKLERFCLRRMIAAADLNLANSQFTSRMISSLAKSNSKIDIVYPGFDVASLLNIDSDRASRLKQDLSGSPILLTVGRLQKRKGQDSVIRALPDLVRIFPSIKYVIIGSSHGGTTGFGAELQALARQLNVESHVVIAGDVTEQLLRLHLSACDLFIMPNRQMNGGDVEGFGIVFLEAGFLRKPVIGGKSGGVQEAIQHGKTGLLVDGSSVQAITEGVLAILTNPSLSKQFGEGGRQFAMEMTADAVFSRLQSVFATHGL